MSKIQQIQDFLNEHELEVAILSEPTSISYISGFYCEPHERYSFLFIANTGEQMLFVPALEVARAQEELDIKVVGYQDSENPWEMIKANWELLEGDVVAEFDHLNVTKFKGLQSIFSGLFSDLSPQIAKMRLIKSEDEIETMKVAGEYADKAMKIAFDGISTNKTEAELLAEIDFSMKKQGIDMSFDTMVLTGDNAANPHGIPGENQIEDNSLLLFDLGCIYNGYASDMTRTVAVGEPDDFQKEIYDLVLKAHLAAIDFIKPGVTASQIDAAARSVIEEAAYGEYFNHRLGHGIGMGLHEFPSIMEGNDLVIEEGMCFSVEPGVYIPGKVGVRVEDCGYVTKDGFEVFTHTPKDLLYFKG